MRSDVGGAWERTPAELLAPREPVPSGRWVRVLAGVLGALAGGGGAVFGFYAGCEQLDCAFLPGEETIIVPAVVAVVMGSLGIAVTLDVQRWRARRRAEAPAVDGR